MTLDAATRDPATPIVSIRHPPVTGESPGPALRDLLDAIFGCSDEATVIVDEIGDITYVTPGTSALPRLRPQRGDRPLGLRLPAS